MAIDRDAVIGAVVGLTMAASLSYAVDGQAGRVAGVVPSATVRGGGMGVSQSPVAAPRAVPWESGSERIPMGSASAQVDSEGPRAMPTFGGVAARRLKPCAHDERLFSDDCNPNR